MWFRQTWRTAMAGGVLLLLLCQAALADVVVVANRTQRRVPIQVTLPGSEPWQVTLSPGESRPIFADSTSQVAFDAGGTVASYTLQPGCVYFLGSRQDGSIDLQQIGLGDDKPFIAGLPGSAATAPVATIPVKILVDDDENTRRNIWEAKLRKRIADASAILHRTAMVKLEVVAVETWNTDNTENNFSKTLKDFEKQVDPFPGQLAIGFSSQYEVRRGRTHMGGTFGPLRPHILLREWSRAATENEKLELLVHELGHYLGASHSPEPDSVMRPVLGGGQARRAGYVIKFDPVNTLLTSMVGEEIRRRRVSRFDQIAPATQERLQSIYKVLGVAKPGDPAAGILSNQLKNRAKGDPASEAARQVLTELTQFARTNQKLPKQQTGLPGPWQVEGDALFDQLVRLAATESLKASKEVQAKAFLLAIGIAIGDPQSQPRRLSAIDRLVQKVETPAEATIRRTYIGEPTIQGRHDLARHFSIASMLVTNGGKESAEAVSLAKELVDSNGGSGFSFADLAADKAGIALAEHLLAGTVTLDQVARGFTSQAFVPDTANLPEGMTTMQFIRQYGGQNDERFQQMKQQIEESIAKLPGYSSEK